MATGKILADKEIFLYKNFTGSNISDWASSSSKNIVTANMQTEVPAGYTALAMTAFHSGNRYLSIYCAGLSYTGTSANLLRGRNYHGSAVNCSNPYVRGIFVRDEMVTVLGASDSVPAGCNTPFIRKLFNATVSSISAKTGTSVSNSSFGYSVPTGYKLFGVCSFYSCHSSVIVCAVTPTTTTNFFRLYNASSSAQSGTAQVVVSFVREDFELSA